MCESKIRFLQQHEWYFVNKTMKSATKYQNKRGNPTKQRNFRIISNIQHHLYQSLVESSECVHSCRVLTFPWEIHRQKLNKIEHES